MLSSCSRSVSTHSLKHKYTHTHRWTQCAHLCRSSIAWIDEVWLSGAAVQGSSQDDRWGSRRQMKVTRVNWMFLRVCVWPHTSLEEGQNIKYPPPIHLVSDWHIIYQCGRRAYCRLSVCQRVRPHIAPSSRQSRPGETLHQLCTSYLSSIIKSEMKCVYFYVNLKMFSPFLKCMHPVYTAQSGIRINVDRHGKWAY